MGGDDYVVTQTEDTRRPFLAVKACLPKGYSDNSTVHNAILYPVQYWRTYRVNHAINSERIRSEFGFMKVKTQIHTRSARHYNRASKTFSNAQNERATSFSPNHFIKEKPTPCILKLFKNLSHTFDPVTMKSVRCDAEHIDVPVKQVKEGEIHQQSREFEEYANFSGLNNLLRLKMGRSLVFGNLLILTTSSPETEESRKSQKACEQIYQLVTEYPEKLLAEFETYDESQKQEITRVFPLPFKTFEIQVKANLYRKRNGLPIL
ncbi:hypothetical protein [Parashewanella curva]|uniref:hypothetical protein n=1 Tax=Parashewanella curva TaxID=2338552 RepID=UPI00105921E3|nr:hypothetical protein [Parashewanella curva]